MKRRLGRDPKAFDAIARSQSKGVEAAAGGYMGRFERGPAARRSSRRRPSPCPRGAPASPCETALGYHVLRVESRQQAREPSLEEARERIRDRLARDKRAEAERAFVAEVLARAKVNHEAALRPSRPS